MPADAKCLCGFTGLEDETLVDHLNVVFNADDTLGNDSLVHEETEVLRCFCGFAAGVSGDMDEHFLKIFMPENSIGRDGKKHLIA